MEDESTYEGTINTITKKPHGKGTIISPEGDKYIGEFKDGRAEGYG